MDDAHLRLQSICCGQGCHSAAWHKLHEIQLGQMQSPAPEEEQAHATSTGWGLTGWTSLLCKGLGESRLSMSQQHAWAAATASSIPHCVNSSVARISKEMIFLLFLAPVRPFLDYHLWLCSLSC